MEGRERSVLAGRKPLKSLAMGSQLRMGELAMFQDARHSTYSLALNAYPRKPDSVVHEIQVAVLFPGGRQAQAVVQAAPVRLLWLPLGRARE